MSFRHATEWTSDEFNSLLCCARALEGHYRIDARRGEGIVTKSAWWTAYILISRDTGLTQRAVLSISRCMVAGNGTVVVRDPKDGLEMIVRLSREAMKAIELIPTRHSILNFPDAPKSSAFKKDWIAILENASSITTSDQLVCNPNGNRLIDGMVEQASSRPSSLRQFFEHIFVPLRLRGKSERTKSLYQTTLRNFARFLQRQPLLLDLNDLTVSQYLTWTRERNRAVHTVDKERSNLLALWRFACVRRLLDQYPAIEKDNLPRRAPTAWQPHELQALFREISSQKGRIGQIKACDWWRALHLIIWNSGERISAVMGLRWEHVDLVSGWLSVPSELRKGKGEDKVFKLASDTIAVLARMKRRCEGKVFPWPYSKTSLWKRYDQILIGAGLAHDKRSKFHRLRRSVASYFEAAGGDSTALLGHSRRSVTTQHYLDQRIVKPKQAAELLFRPDSICS